MTSIIIRTLASLLLPLMAIAKVILNEKGVI